MAEQCPDCGTFMRKAIDSSDDDYWLCVNCAAEDSVLTAVKALTDEMGLTRDRIGAFAFGLADATGFDGASNETIAAACVYLGSILAGDKITQTAISETAEVSVTAIRDAHKKVYDATDFADHFGPIESGELDPDQPHPWFDIEGWREDLRTDHSPDSAKASASNVRRFAVWYEGEGPPTEDDVRAWLGEQATEYAPSTVEGRYIDLRKYAKWAESDIDFEEIDVNEYIAQAWQQRVG